MSRQLTLEQARLFVALEDAVDELEDAVWKMTRGNEDFAANVLTAGEAIREESGLDLAPLLKSILAQLGEGDEAEEARRTAGKEEK